jgi:hypothetical protein
VTSQDRRSLSKLLALGLLGPVPELLGLPPAKRIVVLVTDNAVLLEDHGDLQLRLNPPRWFATLVRLLSNGVASKQAMVAALWGLRAYHPERHDSLIRTTVHRFRALLAPHEDWIFVAESGGYGCSAAIQFVGSVGEPSDLTELEMPLAEGEAPEPIAGPAARVTAAPETLASRAFGLMTGGERLSVRDVARSLGVSDSTALRALRELVAAKRVVRSGHARATRYRARSPS